jgi:BMFP domain-containing protein YqiC
MSEYRDDRQGLLQRIAELETELARAEQRAEHHVVDAIRVGEFKSENELLRQKVKELENQRTPLVSLRPWIATATVTIFALMIAVIILVVRR